MSDFYFASVAVITQPRFYNSKHVGLQVNYTGGDFHFWYGNILIFVRKRTFFLLSNMLRSLSQNIFNFFLCYELWHFNLLKKCNNIKCDDILMQYPLHMPNPSYSGDDVTMNCNPLFSQGHANWRNDVFITNVYHFFSQILNNKFITRLPFHQISSRCLFNNGISV